MLRSAQEHFPDKVCVVVLAALGDKVSLETKIKMVALIVRASVHSGRITFRLDGDMRSFADNREEPHIESVWKQVLEPFDFRAGEGGASLYWRKIREPSDDLEAEVFGNQFLEDPLVGMIEILQETDRALFLFRRLHWAFFTNPACFSPT
jgi:hypothetical protein